MRFDPEGHLVVTPREFENLLHEDPARLVNDVLLQGTPHAFPTYGGYRDFVDFLSAELSVHPATIVFRGSAKLGFSIAPREAKIWRAFGPGSDVDLAVVDADHYHYLDSQVRRWERSECAFWGKDLLKAQNLRKNRSWYCYRHLDLPPTPSVESYRSAMAKASGPDHPGCNCPVTAFFYRDWWALYERCTFDLRALKKELRSALPHGGDEALPRAE